MSTQKNLPTDVYSSFICNSQNSEASKRCPSVGGWINSGVPYNGVLFSDRKKCALKPWKDTEEM